MEPERTREPQYQEHVTLRDQKGLTALGLRANAFWELDPRGLLFTMARHKFVAKLLSGRQRVLEVGCGDAFCTRLVLQEVGSVCAVDFDAVFLEDAAVRLAGEERWKVELRQHDMLDGPVMGPFEAAYSLDVLEHIQPEDERTFLKNAADSLEPHGVLVIGMPSLPSQAYASERSRAGHVNCKDGPALNALMSEFFENVFMFSMNDEVVHTGHHGMAHYLFAVGVGPKGRR